MESASSLTDSAEYGTVRTFSGDLISEASGTLTSSVCASRADRTVSCVFAGLRLDLRSVFALDSVTDIVSTSQNGNNDCLPDVSPSGTSLT
ncbi:hypothetical protein BvCmsNSNP023_05070 [Escherichia coli]|nr:hypothetical protein BvCmsNSNP023_05070 [Escherichia coli]